MVFYFLMSYPHFSKNILEALREPLQDRKVHISRVNAKVAYESNFMFVGAMNPCPCGNLLSKTKPCRCSAMEIKRYKNRLSDPFLDRIDIFVVMQEVSSNDTSDITSSEMKERVVNAFIAQKKRNQPRLNGKLNEDEVEIFCTLSSGANSILNKAIERFGLSHRSITSIKKVSRTIADLDLSLVIEKEHILEALSYRRRES
jgi:magnesium chelatase family protein